MSFLANEELWYDLESRMDLLKESLINKSRTDDVELKRELVKKLYHHGWLETNLRRSRPAPEMSAAAQAAELAAVLQQITQHEEECRII